LPVYNTLLKESCSASSALEKESWTTPRIPSIHDTQLLMVVLHAENAAWGE